MKTSRICVICSILIFCLNISVSSADPLRVVHVFVALCDNEHQRIVRVPQEFGNGDDPQHNLYWGAGNGVKTFFTNSPHWVLIDTITYPLTALNYSSGHETGSIVLERCIFKHRQANVYVVADAYRGREIRQAIIDFLDSASGKYNKTIIVKSEPVNVILPCYGSADLIVYLGHNGLMDFYVADYQEKCNDKKREVIILSCSSKKYFKKRIARSGAKPLLWTTGLMAPEAYTLENAVQGWVLHETDEKIRLRAAQAYHKYQKCGLDAAKRLFATGCNSE